MNTTRSEKIPRRTKLFYGSGDIGFALTDTTIGVFFAIYLTDVVSLDPGLAALAVFIGRSWDYINDPLIGYISDRTRTRWGRRRPFLLFGFIPFALAFSMLWWTPPTSNAYLLAGYYALAYMIYEFTATLVYMPYFALTPELTLDYDERTSLTSYRMAFSILGGMIAFIVPMIIIGSMSPENRDKVFLMGALFAWLAALPLLTVFFGTRERKEFMEQEPPRFTDSIKAALRNRTFIFASGVFLFTWAAIEIIQGVLLYFLKYRMNLEAQSELISASVFIAALLTLPFWVWLSQRWDKRRAYILGMIFLTLVMAVLVLIQPSISLAVVILLAALAGVGVGAVHVLTWAMIPDAIEWDQLHTGKRHEGMFYSLVTLFRKIASSLTLPIILLSLKWSGYVSNAPVQTPAAINTIRALTALVPALLLGLGILFALFYPLSRDRHEEIRHELAEQVSSGD
jgi:glycoside/pentoside/hexuronide:cation symporter, GPH family